MPYRVQPADAIKRLTQEVHEKQEALAQLEQEKEQLISHQLLLNALLNAFVLVLGSTSSAEEQQLLLQLDGLQLQQSSASSSSFSAGSSSTFSADAPADPDLDCRGQQVQSSSSGASQQQLDLSMNSIIAPEHDPVGPVMGVVPQKQLDTASLTLQQLQQDYKGIVSTISANISLLDEQQLHCASIQMDSSTPGGSSSSADEAAAGAAAAALCNIQESLQEYWGQLNMLMKAGRGPLLHTFFITHLITGTLAARAVLVADVACRYWHCAASAAYRYC
jgi:hypothetical protein